MSPGSRQWQTSNAAVEDLNDNCGSIRGALACSAFLNLVVRPAL